MKIFGLPEEEIKKQARNGFEIAVIGFGYVGISIGALLSKNNSITAIDVNTKILDAVNRGESPINEPGVEELIKSAAQRKKIRATSDISTAKNCDVILVTVGTPLGKDYEPNFEYITKVSENLGPLLQKGDMIILKSTVTPGTTEGVVREILEKKSGLKAGEDFGLAFCPERLAEGSAIRDLQNLPIVAGGINKKSSATAVAFWQSLGFATVPVSSAKTAEMTKLADNLWIDLNIALGNEIAKLSEKVGVNAVEVIESANTLSKGRHMVNILYPGAGVGGSCLVKDPWFVYHMGKKHGIDLKTPRTSREVNESMPQHMFSLVKSALEEAGKGIDKSRIAVLGLAFKGGTGDTRSTPAKPFIDLLQNAGCDVIAFDPWVESEEAGAVTESLAQSVEEAVQGADCIVIETDHPEFKKLDIKKIKALAGENAAIVDGRNVVDAAKIKESGMIYRGVGRGR